MRSNCDELLNFRLGDSRCNDGVSSKPTRVEDHMKMTILLLCPSILALVLVFGIGDRPAASGQPANKLDELKIAKAAATKATVAPDGVVRIGWSRTDVAVTVDGMPFKPSAGLGS